MRPQKLPRVRREHLTAILREAANKIEAGTTLGSGVSANGHQLTEAAIVAAALRAVAAGRSPYRALGGSGPRGPDPLERAKLTSDIETQRTKLGTLTAARKAVARQRGMTTDAIEKAHKRIIKAEREVWRNKWESGKWHLPLIVMTDAELAAAAGANLWEPANEREHSIQLIYLKRRRDADLAFFREQTGWQKPPPQGQVKAP